MCMEMQLIAKQDVRFSFFFFHLKVKKVQLKKKFTNNKIIPNTEVPIRGIKNQAKTNASCIPGSEKIGTNIRILPLKDHQNMP